MTAVVCTEVEVARDAIRGGEHVVLIGADGTDLGLAAARLAAESTRGGRVSVFVGDPSRVEVWSAAASMAAEQYRCEVRLERSVPAAPRPASGGGQVP